MPAASSRPRPRPPHPHTLSSQHSQLPSRQPLRGCSPPCVSAPPVNPPVVCSPPSQLQGWPTSLPQVSSSHPLPVLQSCKALAGLWLEAPSQLPGQISHLQSPLCVLPGLHPQSPSNSPGLYGILGAPRNSAGARDRCHGPQAPWPGGIQRGSWGSQCSGYGA